MQFDWTMNVGQVVQTLSLLLALVGLWFTYLQVRRAATVQTAEMLKDVIFTFFGDEKIQKTYYRIGSGDLKFDPEKFGDAGSEDEQALDQLLYLFECVGRLYSLGLIRKDDLLLRYRITKVFQSPEVVSYIKYLDEEVYPKTLGPGARSFRNARELVNALGQHRSG